MRKQNWPKRDPIKNYFPLPNEIYALGLSSTAIAVYGYLLHREDRKTYQCLASYRMIGETIGKCTNTVRKYVMTHPYRAHHHHHPGRPQAEWLPALHHPADPNGHRPVL